MQAGVAAATDEFEQGRSALYLLFNCHESVRGAGANGSIYTRQIPAAVNRSCVT